MASPFFGLPLLSSWSLVIFDNSTTATTSSIVYLICSFFVFLLFPQPSSSLLFQHPVYPLNRFPEFSSREGAFPSYDFWVSCFSCHDLLWHCSQKNDHNVKEKLCCSRSHYSGNELLIFLLSTKLSKTILLQ